MLRSAILALTTVIAVGGTAAVAAAASPELSPAPSGCHTCERGEYAFVMSSGSGIMDSQAGFAWKYEKASGSARGISSTALYAEPKWEGLSYSCSEFIPNDLTGHFGKVSKEQVGLLLEPSRGETFERCSSKVPNYEVTGSMIGTLGPVNTPTKELGVTYEQNSEREQIPNKFEGEATTHALDASFEGAPSEYFAIGGVLTLKTYSNNLEVNTVSGTPEVITAYNGGFSVNGGTMNFISKGGLQMLCKSMTTSAGSFTNAKEGTLKLKFAGCKGPLGGSCSTVNPGEIETTELKATLVYTHPGKEAALLLSPVSGEKFASLTCEYVGPTVLTGAIVAPITPTGSAANVFPLKFEQKKGTQDWTEYENGSGEVLRAILQTSIEEHKAEQSGIEVKSLQIKLNDGGEETIH